MNDDGANWQRDVIAKLASDALAEQKRARRWGIVFKVLTFTYLFILLFVGLGWVGQGDGIQTGDHTALVELNGIIAADSHANADDVSAGLKAAFEADGTQAVVLRINSPGGSPVQSAAINNEIRRYTLWWKIYVPLAGITLPLQPTGYMSPRRASSVRLVF